MSHIVQITTQVRDVAAARSACQRCNLQSPEMGTAKLFSVSATGLIVRLPTWRYPVVFDLEAGIARFDNFNGRWGESVQLERFLQMYAVAATKLQARRKGHACTEQLLDDGSVKLTVSLGGAT